MKSIRRYYLLLSILLVVGCKSASVVEKPTIKSSNFEKLAGIENIVSIEKKATVSHFDENYELWFEQPIDYTDSTKGTFKQCVFLGFENSTQPVIVELSGYGINSEKAGELASHYNANQIAIEHRYFNNSRPENIDWNTLTVKNAAKDQAVIITAIKKTLYPDAKFISTGISKGCQTVMAHRSYFPENVDGCVCYVGPLNLKREDDRIFEFLKTVGTEAERAKVKAFQELCFENKAGLLKILKTKADEKEMSWEFGVEKALEYSILEYAFAYWQWGTEPEEIPSKSASVSEIYKHLFDVVGYGFFEEKAVANLQPYFWAALTEQGIYGYETMPFEKYLHTDKLYTFDWAFPEGITKTYNLKPMQRIQAFLDSDAEKMLFIYGEYDAWSATAVELAENANNRELYKFVKPKGDHKTRIHSFKPKKQQEIYSIIDSWLE
ncbi:S28 family serine protease [Aequorivita marina]|uniref:S28 family serine protease n=1 Tax=Aequorivita marina TaxID=3073654 RepID=UPI00287411FD|nr:S28 family serine protease [Aequorivita sp. S2608]MDS1297766.1 S28 family serine protease [Aequorivita sp. S2608]